MNEINEQRNKIPESSERSTQALASSKKDGDDKKETRDSFIIKYMYLVKRIAYKYASSGVSYDDLYQEGCYGLILAVDKYDPSKGASFETYATTWIRKYILQAIYKQNLLLPIVPNEEVYYSLQRYTRAFSELRSLLGRPPTVPELAEKMNCTEDAVQSIINDYIRYVYLDSKPQDSNSSNDSGFIYSSGQNAALNNKTNSAYSPSSEDEYFKAQSILDLSEYGVSLSKYEETALRMYLGFNESGKPMSFKKISLATGRGQESIRRDYYSAVQKIQDKILKKI